MIDDFRDVLAALVAANARFLVVGAHALAAHGVPRVTGDLDLWVDATVENADKVWRALADFGAPLAALRIDPAHFTKPDQVIQLGLPPFRIDILTSITGVTFEDAWDGRLEGVLYGVLVFFVGREAFLRNKRQSARPKDIQDIRSLEGE